MTNSTPITKQDLQKHKTVYYARIVPQTYIYEVCELIIRTIEDDYFVGTDKHDKHAYLLTYNDLDKIFAKRADALSVVKLAEAKKPKIKSESYYEEY